MEISLENVPTVINIDTDVQMDSEESGLTSMTLNNVTNSTITNISETGLSDLNN